MTTPDLLCLKCPQFCGEFCSEGFGALKANMLGKKGMIHQSLYYKDFQKLLFLHLGGLFHKLTLALEKWNFVKSTSSKQEKWTSYGCWCTSESTNIFFSNGHLFWVQKYQSQPFETSPSKGFGSHVASRPFYFAIKAHKKSYPHKWPSHKSSNFSVFFSVGIVTLRFSQVGFYCHLGAQNSTHFNWGATSTKTPQVI